MTQFTQIFDSLEEMLSFSAKHPLIPRKMPMAYVKSYDVLFHGTATYEEAETLARKGWAQGREKMFKAYAEAQPLSVILPEQTYDVAGAYPCVPLACAGDPANMVSFQEGDLRAPSPIIRIGVNVWSSSGYSQTEITNYGAAVLSYVDALEASFYRVELIALVYCKFQDGAIFSQEIIIKRAEQHIELDRVAFVFCNAAFFRRIAYAAREKDPKLTRKDVLGYAKTMPPRSDMLTLAGVDTLSHAQLSTPQKAAQSLAPLIEAQLSALGYPSPQVKWDTNKGGI